MSDIWISITEAATRLGVSYHTARNWALKKKLRSKLLPPLNTRVVDAADVERVRQRIHDGGTSRVH
jgi:transposase